MKIVSFGSLLRECLSAPVTVLGFPSAPSALCGIVSICDAYLPLVAPDTVPVLSVFLMPAPPRNRVLPSEVLFLLHPLLHSSFIKELALLP